MRKTVGLTLALGVSLSAGCLFMPKKPDNRDIKMSPVLPSKASAESLVNYLNDNAKLVSSLRAEIAMDVRQKGIGAEPVGQMACQKPNDFRLRAKAMGMDEVDLVSNSEEMAFWIKRADPTKQFVCTHKDLAAGKVKMNVPIQPDMVLIALGMKEYDPKARYQLKDGDARVLELVTDATGIDGRPIKRVVVFNRKPVTGNESQIVGHVLKDADGKVICKALTTKAFRDRSGAIVPSVVDITYPAEELTMRLTLSDIRLNTITKEDAASLFTRSPIRGAEVYDLARGAPVGGGLSRAGYYPR